MKTLQINKREADEQEVATYKQKQTHKLKRMN